MQRAVGEDDAIGAGTESAGGGSGVLCAALAALRPCVRSSQPLAPSRIKRSSTKRGARMGAEKIQA
jgi:hypothetical protein